MKQPLSILVLEGNQPSRELPEHRLNAEFGPCICRRVTGVTALTAAMDDARWDLVLADYAVPGSDFIDAFAAVQIRLPDVPVILIADSIAEQQATELLQLGVWDSLLSEDGHRLSHLVKHALRDSDRSRAARAAERASKRSEDRYQQVFLNASDSLFVFPLSPDGQPGRFTDVNQAASEMLGYTTEELLQFSPPDLVPPSEREQQQARFRELLSEKRQHVELLLTAKDGQPISVEISATLFNLESQPTVLGIVTDVTGKKRTAEMLHQAAAAAIRQHRVRVRRDVVVMASLGILSMFAVNYLSGFERLSSWILRYGQTALGEVAMTFVFLIVATAVYASRRNGDLGREVAARRQTEDALHAVRDELETRVKRRTAELTRANDNLRAEIATRERNETILRLQSAALDASADAIVITDEQGRIAWVNPAFTTLTGYGTPDALGKKPGELIKSGAQDEMFYKQMWGTIRSGHAWRGEVTNRRKDGSLYSENMTITPVKDSNDVTTHFVAIKRDLTDQKQLEAQFLQAQKMESVGRLAGGIAHDFNNLLTVINGTAELASISLVDDDPMRADLGEIHRAGERAAALTRQLLAFSRKQVMKPQVLNLTTLVAGLQSLLQRVIGEDVSLVLDPEAGSSHGLVRVDPGQLEQVLMNLVVNARDAMPKGGTVTIETRDIDVDDPRVAQRESIDPGSYVVLSVRDTGTGMDAETRARLFEPFFTTKEQGKGTGLGLATVHGIVAQSGGRISVETAPGMGTTFKVYLPRLADATLASPRVGTAAVAAGSETILVVEDEPGVREMARRMLAMSGYVVLTASNAAEALQLLAGHREVVHLMLTDVVMPGMSGPELALRAADVRPQMKILFTSGHTENAAMRLSARDKKKSFIGKPYARAELLNKVRETLDSPANGTGSPLPPAAIGRSREAWKGAA